MSGTNDETESPNYVPVYEATKQRSGVIRLAVIGLIGVGGFAILSTVFLLGLDKDVPEGVLALGSAAVGALSTLLVSDNTRR